MMDWLKDTPVLVLGLGDSGLAMARWCARFGAAVTVWDSREVPPGAGALREQFPAVSVIGGVLQVSQLDGCQLVLKSPGLAPHDARIAPLLQAARDTGIAVMGELDLFARALADLKAAHGYVPQVLAITGTNGKTTVTSLTGLLVERAGRRVAVAGNIGPTMLDTLSAALDAAGDSLASAHADDQAAAPVDVAEPHDAAPLPEVAADLETEDESAAETLPIQPSPPPELPLPQVWVLELSSFQLEGGGDGLSTAAWGFDPSAAVVLNVTQDHLDWHGSMAAYTAAKARVYGRSARMLINRDDPALLAMVPLPEVGKPVKGKPRLKPVIRQTLHFGLDVPQRPGDFGLVTENGMDWLVRALPTDETFKRKPRPQGRRDAATVPLGESGALGRPGAAWDEAEEIHLQRLMPADALRIRGRHNASNALAALALATAIGCPLAPMLHGLREYTGEPHRVQFVARVDDVEAFDDSKGTNVGATVAALDGLGADKAPGKLVLILGGDGKGQDFSPLAAPLARHGRAVATIGKDAAAIEAAIEAAIPEHAVSVPLQRFDTLESAVRWCFEQAQRGDAVLLSPACASLDMFRNYGHRAQVFADAVQAHAADRGQA
jgi:UDP-N-acetylmuramoylalanine--D-glutamate ligase